MLSQQVIGYNGTKLHPNVCFITNVGCTNMPLIILSSTSPPTYYLTLNYSLQSSWSSSWRIWCCEWPRSVSRCPTGFVSSASGSALHLLDRCSGSPGHTGWTTILSGCAECCSSPPCGCRWSRMDCSRRCPRRRRWTEPCPGSDPGRSHGKHHLYDTRHTCRSK